jgi:hypothetical protein
VDPGGEVADGRVLHLIPLAKILEQDRPQLDDLQRGLAPSDDGVHTRTIAVVGADSTVAVAVEPRRIAAGTAIALTGNEIGERLIAELNLGRYRRERLHNTLSPLTGSGSGQGAPDRMTTPEGYLRRVWPSIGTDALRLKG